MPEELTPRPEIASQLEHIASVLEDRVVWLGGRHPADGINHRFDFDLPSESVIEDPDLWRKELPVIIGPDVEDIVVNGDREHPNDPLLMSIDGEKKRGRPFDEVELTAAVIYTTHKASVVEYTFYIKLLTQ